MEYKLIASDLDGTLLGADRKISKENKDAISRATAQGVIFCIATGRSHTSAGTFDKELNYMNTYGIAFNGGLIYKTKTQEIIYERRLKNELGLQVVAEASEYNIYPILYALDNLYTKKTKSEFVTNYVNHVKINPNYVSDYSEINEDFSKILFTGEREELLKFYNKLSQQNPDYNFFFSANHLLEITDKLVTKGKTLEKLAEILNVKLEETIAMGDNFNDISMIKAAGLGIVVQNGETEVKKIADYVTENNSETAVSEVIGKFIFPQ